MDWLRFFALKRVRSEGFRMFKSVIWKLVEVPNSQPTELIVGSYFAILVAEKLPVVTNKNWPANARRTT
jgi:hypothetical protein